MNVNHNAAVCGAFLKGYCEEGNNCKLKHTRECQSYNKNGYCPDKLNGRCKLQHNRESKHGKKKKKIPRTDIVPEVISQEEQVIQRKMQHNMVPKFIGASPGEFEYYDSSSSSGESDSEEETGESEESELLSQDSDEESQESSEEEPHNIPIPSFL